MYEDVVKELRNLLHHSRGANYHSLDVTSRTTSGEMSMIETIVTMCLWGLITITLLVKGEISLEYAYIGMCMMLAAGMLYKEE